MSEAPAISTTECVPIVATVQDVLRESQYYVHQIFPNYETLGSILSRHESVIFRRWTKKTRAQRLKVLLAAWPNMPLDHRPDFTAARTQPKANVLSDDRYRDMFLFPYINQHDLSRPNTLPLFLHARGTTSPCYFALSDSRAFLFGSTTDVITPHQLDGYMMMLIGRTTSSTYGELHCLVGDERACCWERKNIGISPGQGLLILEVQYRILEFLNKCCRIILSDLDTETLDSPLYPVQPAFQPPSQSNSDEFQSLSILAGETSYRVPIALDWRRLHALLAASKSAAEDHVWALREDPGYFADCVLECKEHRRELVKDASGRIDPIITRRPDEIWLYAVMTVVKEPYLLLETWTELQLQAQNLIHLEEKYRSLIGLAHEPPIEYLDAIMKFLFHIGQAAKGLVYILKDNAASSPGLCQYFFREPRAEPCPCCNSLHPKPGVKHDRPTYELLWLLSMFMEDDERLTMAGFTDVIDELQRLISNDGKVKKLISPLLARVIGDLSIVSECSRQVELYQPWAIAYRAALFDRHEGFQDQLEKRMAPFGLMSPALRAVRTIGSLGNPEDGKFRYPVQRRRTKDIVHRLQCAEAHLDSFWQRIDQITSKIDGIDNLAISKLLARSRTLSRTPEWAEPNNGQTQGCMDPLIDLCKPLSEIYFDLEHRTRTLEESTKNIAKPKEKKKTKGIFAAHNGPLQDTILEESNHSEAEQSTVSVDKRALKVFRTLFHQPSPSATPGEVSWKDFLHAMTASGFRTEKLYGSVWRFSPTNLDIDRGIHFHEPHPGGKLPYRTARRFGRRLEKAYGWNGAMFVLAEKKEEGAI